MDVYSMLYNFLVLALSILLFFLYYSGFFDCKPNVSDGPPYIGQVVVAYKYVETTCDCDRILSQSAKIAPNRALIIIYYDERQVPLEKCCMAAGCIMSNPDGTVSQNLWREFKKEDFKQIALPAAPNSVNASFTYANRFSLSLAKKYALPRISAYIKEKDLKAYPRLEVRDEGKIHYMLPLSRNNEFFVPESLDTFM